MDAMELRNKLLEYINTADTGLLQRLEDVIKNYRKEDSDTLLTKEHQEILDARLANHKDNPQAGRNWSEIKDELSVKYGV
jgi:hypothetical protein